MEGVVLQHDPMDHGMKGFEWGCYMNVLSCRWSSATSWKYTSFWSPCLMSAPSFWKGTKVIVPAYPKACADPLSLLFIITITSLMQISVMDCDNLKYGISDMQEQQDMGDLFY